MTLSEEIIRAAKVLHHHNQRGSRERAYNKVDKERRSAEAQLLIDEFEQLGIDIASEHGQKVLQILIAHRIAKAEVGPVSAFGASGSSEDW